MPSTTNNHDGTCTRCGSPLTFLDWEERFDSHQIQKLWRCLACKNEFVTFHASEEKPMTSVEIIKPFFTNLVVE